MVDTSLTGDAFRQHVRSILEDILPDDLRGTMTSAHIATKDGLVRWQRLLDEQGLWLINFPEKYGGTTLTPEQVEILTNEFVRIGAPPVDIQALWMIGPVLYTFGSEAQKDHFLSKIKRTELWWCQGFSEPGAGSDLFSLKTTAIRDGDDYVVNGQKIWTSRAHWADTMFAIVRTPESDTETRKSFSFFLIDMDTPGIDVRPIRSIDNGHHLNEVFFEDVRVPADRLVGREGQGQDITRFLLTMERYSLTVVDAIRKRLDAAETAALQNRCARDLKTNILTDIAAARIDASALETTLARAFATDSNTGNHALAASLKVMSSNLEQRSTELWVEACGHDVFELGPFEDGMGEIHHHSQGQMAMIDYIFLRAASIYGGANEVQKNIIFRSMSR